MNIFKNIFQRLLKLPLVSTILAVALMAVSGFCIASQITIQQNNTTIASQGTTIAKKEQVNENLVGTNTNLAITSSKKSTAIANQTAVIATQNITIANLKGTVASQPTITPTNPQTVTPTPTGTADISVTPTPKNSAVQDVPTNWGLIIGIIIAFATLLAAIIGLLAALINSRTSLKVEKERNARQESQQKHEMKVLTGQLKKRTK